ncbi:hypothetical protein [Nostoc sp. FACHB-133]|uniref:hypothetical protein n=1 Tax=Nostoc sp. FACHB-133 TaxID=2692835 RepID=UPI001686C62B|nr:hypothetical protein [Nostoc sp. FACHB-133]MBD2525425.1 hypothetical protein [Nostoc sp. FACHB-133]
MSKVDTVLCVNGSVLIVFYTAGQCWQFRIISRTGGIFGEQKLYYSVSSSFEDWVSVYARRHCSSLRYFTTALSALHSWERSPMVGGYAIAHNCPCVELFG